MDKYDIESKAKRRIVGLLKRKSDGELVSLWNDRCFEKKYPDEVIYRTDENFGEQFPQYSPIGIARIVYRSKADFSPFEKWFVITGYPDLYSSDDSQDLMDLDLLAEFIVAEYRHNGDKDIKSVLEDMDEELDRLESADVE